MSNIIKLFKAGFDGAGEMPGVSFRREKDLQNLIENNLEAFFGIRFLAAEYRTERSHGGVMDTLGIDKKNHPVIIEYKRKMDESIIPQILSYLHDLRRDKRGFKNLVERKISENAAAKVDWSKPRLLCIAGDFNERTVVAAEEADRNIELIRYRRYSDDLLLFEFVNRAAMEATGKTAAGKTPAVSSKRPAAAPGPKTERRDKTVTEYLEQAAPAQRGRYKALKAFMLALGDDVRERTNQNYFGFKRKNKNFAEVVPQAKGNIIIFIHVDPATVSLTEGFTRDMSQIGHVAPGNLQVTIKDDKDLKRAKPLIAQSYAGRD